MGATMKPQTELKKDDLLATFLANVENNPKKIAIVSADKHISYEELNTNINQIADYIKKNSPDLFDPIKKPLMIGVLCHDKLHALYSILAIIKLGATFVPFSAQDLQTRMDFVIQKSGVSLILTDDAISISPNLSHVDITPCLEDVELKAQLSSTEPDTDSVNDDYAYVLFTSGSTANQPKGVLQSRGALSRQIANYQADLQITEKDCLLNLATFTHDQAIVDCFGALLTGSTLCLFEANNMDVKKLQQFMKDNNVTIFSSIPSMFGIIFEDITDPMTFPNLRIVTIGGEETKISHAKLFQKNCPPNCLLINGYGATEISWVSSFTINHETDLEKLQSIPLGYPTKTAEILMLEEDGHFELCIGSDCLSPGYLDDITATNNAFFTDDTGKRFYKTGDYVTKDADGCLQFQGRKNWHEKISGKRINLKEVEDALQSNGFGKDPVVLAFGEGEKRKLYAFYFEPISGSFTSTFAKLKTILPSHMMPKKMFFLKEKPTLPNGKINRHALLKNIEEIQDKKELNKIPFEALKNSNDIEKVIEGYWREALDLPIDSPLDSSSFKDLGGDSQLAIQLTNRLNRFIEKKFQIPGFLEPVNLFKNETSDFESFSNYAINAYKDIKRSQLLNDCYILPVMREITNSDCKQLIDYDYRALKILVNYFNKKYNINMYFGESHEAIIDKIKKNMEDPNCPKQTGLFLLRVNSANSHPVSAVLYHDTPNNKFFLFIADSTPYSHNLARMTAIDGLLTKIRINIPTLEFLFDTNGRQRDARSCSTATILYLCEVLQLDMLSSCQVLDKPDEDLHILESYYIEKTGVSYTNCKSFISPPEGYKYTQLDLPDLLDSSQSLRSDDKNRILEQYIQENENELFKKSYEFRDIVQDYLTKVILPDLFHFSIKYDEKDKDMYIFKNNFNPTMDIENFIEILCTFLNISSKQVNGLFVGNKPLTCMKQLLGALNDTLIIITVITDKNIELKENYDFCQQFIHKYKETYLNNPLSFLNRSLKPSHFDKSIDTTDLKTIFTEAASEDNGTKVRIILNVIGWTDIEGNLINQHPVLLKAQEEALQYLQLEQSEIKPFPK